MILFLDTVSSDGTTIELVGPAGFSVRRCFFSRLPAERLADRVRQLIGRSVIRGIAVATGHGGFTASRSGVVVANALGYAWQVPVVAVGAPPVSRFRPLLPAYDRQPTITLATT